MTTFAWTEARFTARDGAQLAFLTAGSGRSALLIHGFLADGMRNWIAPGIAGRLVAEGFRVIVPDLRGHGASAAPTDPALWRPDMLCEDQFDLLAHLALKDYDLIGYSLGARTAARMLVRGERPRRAVLGGMGASGLREAGARAALFEDAIRHGAEGKNPEAGRRIQFMMRQGGLKRDALLGVLSTFVSTPADALAKIPTPTLVLAGTHDDDNGSAEELAGLLANARALRTPGDHLTAVTQPAFADAIARFLTANP